MHSLHYGILPGSDVIVPFQLTWKDVNLNLVSWMIVRIVLSFTHVQGFQNEHTVEYSDTDAAHTYIEPKYHVISMANYTHA